jgi:membrane protein YdbS with pleckstrin-like domain
MKLNVYQSCSREEKRDVLEAFWRRSATPSARILQAACQYGPFAMLCILAVALELALVVVSLHRAIVVGSIAATLEVLVLVSLGWALVRWRTIRGQAS